MLPANPETKAKAMADDHMDEETEPVRDGTSKVGLEAGPDENELNEAAPLSPDAEDEGSESNDEDEENDAKEKKKVPRINRQKSQEDEEEDDDDDLLDDDVEADLDRILKDRMVATDEDDEQEVVDDRSESVEGIQPKQQDEKMCPQCFLIVRVSTPPNCPAGDGPCPV